jgi:hypothetical protein
VLTSLFPLFIGPAVLLPIAAYAVLHRRVRAAGWYAALLVVIAHWSMTYAWELTAGTLEFKVIVLKIKYLGVLAIPAIWIGFVLDFVGTEPARIRRTVRVMAAFSLTMLALAWTDGWHHLFWGPITVDSTGPFGLLIGRGPGFYINIFYTYAALWAGIGILGTRAFQSPYLYARRCGILIAATLLAMFSACSASGGSDNRGADEAPGVAQVRQSFQVIFLLYGLVVPFVTGLFFLIITVQKAGALTLLRAIGAPSRRLVSALLVQVVIIVGLGLVVGIALYTPLTLVTATALGLRFETTAVVVWSALLLVLGVLSSLLAARRVLAIDPVTATTGAGVR